MKNWVHSLCFPARRERSPHCPTADCLSATKKRSLASTLAGGDPWNMALSRVQLASLGAVAILVSFPRNRLGVSVFKVETFERDLRLSWVRNARFVIRSRFAGIRKLNVARPSTWVATVAKRPE